VAFVERSRAQPELQLLCAFGAIEHVLVALVLLVLVDDLDARAAEGIEQLVKLVRGRDVRRQQLVDLLVVSFFDRQGRVLRCARGHPPVR
jgi:hypothetical protein